MQRQRARRRGGAPRHFRPRTSDDGTGATVKLDRAERKNPRTFAHGMTRTRLHREWAVDGDAAAGAEARALCMQTQDFQRASAAFAAKQARRCEGN